MLGKWTLLAKGNFELSFLVFRRKKNRVSVIVGKLARSWKWYHGSRFSVSSKELIEHVPILGSALPLDV